MEQKSPAVANGLPNENVRMKARAATTAAAISIQLMNLRREEQEEVLKHILNILGLGHMEIKMG